MYGTGIRPPPRFRLRLGETYSGYYPPVEPEASADPRTGKARPDGSGPVPILYIEDNAANVLLMQAIFATQPGLTLTCATSARQGLELARSRQPRLVLLDLHLPDASGADVLRELKDDAATSGVPVVVVSADARADALERARAAGAEDFVTKPLEIHTLLDVVQRSLDRGR